jgi:hypothetical protein
MAPASRTNSPRDQRDQRRINAVVRNWRVEARKSAPDAAAKRQRRDPDEIARARQEMRQSIRRLIDES